MKKLAILSVLLGSLLFFSTGCCHDYPIPCQERVVDGCACPENYEPVCGCNGKTYGNACEAICHGIYDFTPGECQ